MTKVCLVAVKPKTFELCQQGYYPVPVDYPRNDKNFSYFGFYRIAPVSAVTHVAQINESKTEKPGQRIDQSTWDSVLSEDEAVLYNLKDLEELENPVENDLSSGLRGAWYTSLEEVKAADKLSNLT